MTDSSLDLSDVSDETESVEVSSDDSQDNLSFAGSGLPKKAFYKKLLNELTGNEMLMQLIQEKKESLKEEQS